MITQSLIDFVSQLVAGIIGLIPPFPAEVQGAIGWVSDGMVYIGGLVEPMGIVIPFDALHLLVLLWQVLLGFWGAAMLIRAILWLAGR